MDRLDDLAVLDSSRLEKRAGEPPLPDRSPGGFAPLNGAGVIRELALLTQRPPWREIPRR